MNAAGDLEFGVFGFSQQGSKAKQCVDQLDFANNPGLTKDALVTTDHAHNFKALRA